MTTSVLLPSSSDNTRFSPRPRKPIGASFKPGDGFNLKQISPKPTPKSTKSVRQIHTQIQSNTTRSPTKLQHGASKRRRVLGPIPPAPVVVLTSPQTPISPQKQSNITSHLVQQPVQQQAQQSQIDIQPQPSQSQSTPASPLPPTSPSPVDQVDPTPQASTSHFTLDHPPPSPSPEPLKPGWTLDLPEDTSKVPDLLLKSALFRSQLEIYGPLTKQQTRGATKGWSHVALNRLIKPLPGTAAATSATTKPRPPVPTWFALFKDDLDSISGSILWKQEFIAPVDLRDIESLRDGESSIGLARGLGGGGSGSGWWLIGTEFPVWKVRIVGMVVGYQQAKDDSWTYWIDDGTAVVGCSVPYDASPIIRRKRKAVAPKKKEEDKDTKDKAKEDKNVEYEQDSTEEVSTSKFKQGSLVKVVGGIECHTYLGRSIKVDRIETIRDRNEEALHHLQVSRLFDEVYPEPFDMKKTLEEISLREERERREEERRQIVNLTSAAASTASSESGGVERIGRPRRSVCALSLQPSFDSNVRPINLDFPPFSQPTYRLTSLEKLPRSSFTEEMFLMYIRQTLNHSHASPKKPFTLSTLLNSRTLKHFVRLMLVKQKMDKDLKKQMRGIEAHQEHEWERNKGGGIGWGTVKGVLAPPMASRARKRKAQGDLRDGEEEEDEATKWKKVFDETLKKGKAPTKKELAKYREVFSTALCDLIRKGEIVVNPPEEGKVEAGETSAASSISVPPASRIAEQRGNCSNSREDQIERLRCELPDAPSHSHSISSSTDPYVAIRLTVSTGEHLRSTPSSSTNQARAQMIENLRLRDPSEPAPVQRPSSHQDSPNRTPRASGPSSNTFHPGQIPPRHPVYDQTPRASNPSLQSRSDSSLLSSSTHEESYSLVTPLLLTTPILDIITSTTKSSSGLKSKRKSMSTEQITSCLARDSQWEMVAKASAQHRNRNGGNGREKSMVEKALERLDEEDRVSKSFEENGVLRRAMWSRGMKR